MRALTVTLLLALAGTLVVDLEPGSAPQAARPVAVGAVKTVTPAKTVEVVFLRRDRLVAVERVVPRGARPARVALRELLRGLVTNLQRLSDALSGSYLAPATISRSLASPGLVA